MTTELCVGVKILVERMESNPEDFEEGTFDYARDRYIETRRFRYVRKCLEEVFKNPDSDKWVEWRYLTAEERDALMAAFIKMERKKFDKSIMDLLLAEEPKPDPEISYGQLIRNPAPLTSKTLRQHAIQHEITKAQIEAQIKRDDMLDAQRLTMLGKMEEWINK